MATAAAKVNMEKTWVRVSTDDNKKEDTKMGIGSDDQAIKWLQYPQWMYGNKLQLRRE